MGFPISGSGEQTATWYGQNVYDNSGTYNQTIVGGIEQKIALHVAADGVYTITRRWVGSGENLAGLQTEIRTPMPPFDTDSENEAILQFSAASGASGSIADVNALCIASDIDPVEGKAELYMLTETYQGYVALPFTIYSWTTSRLDIPITQNPNFNGGSALSASGQSGSYPNAMLQGVHWQLAGTPLTFTGFPAFNVDSMYTSSFSGSADSGSITGTPNPYVGITDYASATGVWKKTTFFGSVWAADPSGSGSYQVPDNLMLSGRLWKTDKPDLGPYYSSNLFNIPDPDNTGQSSYTGSGYINLQSGYVTWVKSQEDFQNLYRGASSVWQLDESWWANIGRGWRKDIYDY